MANRFRNDPDASDAVGPKLRRGIDLVEQGYADRWPIRGQANVKSGEHRPFEDVSREGRQVPYRKWPSAKD